MASDYAPRMQMPKAPARGGSLNGGFRRQGCCDGRDAASRRRSEVTNRPGKPSSQKTLNYVADCLNWVPRIVSHLGPLAASCILLSHERGRGRNRIQTIISATRAIGTHGRCPDATADGRVTR